MAESTSPRHTIRAIEGLRGLGAIGIVLFHMGESLSWSPEFGFMTGWFHKYFLLLDLFFIISGFGIASGYARTFSNGVGPGAYGRFLWGRFIRLYPLYLLVLVLMAVIELTVLYLRQNGIWDPGYEPFHRADTTWANWLTSVFMVQAWGFHNKLVWNIPGWYVSALICAYLVFPFFAWGVARVSERFRGPLLVILAGGATLGLHYAFQRGMFPAPNDMSPLRAIIEFMLGYGIALLPAGPSWRRWLQLPLAILVFLALHQHWSDMLTLTLMTVFFWTLLDDQGLVATLLGTSVLVWLGAISYGVFIIHQPVMYWMGLLGNSPLAQQVWIFWQQYFSWNLALRWVLIILIGWALTRFVAEPARRWLQPRQPAPGGH